MTTDADKIFATLETYAAAYCAKDVDRLMALFIDGDGISLIGTGADELCAGRKQVAEVFTRNFAEATALSFDWGWRDIAIHGDSAVVSVALRIHLETVDGPLSVPLRWTVSLVRESDRWRWIHRHASVAAGGQADGAAYPSGR